VHHVGDAGIAELGAAFASSLDVAQMDEEIRRAVDVMLVDVVLESRDLGVAVGHIPDGGEDDRRIRRDAGQGRSDGRESSQTTGPQDSVPGADSRPLGGRSGVQTHF
jgi:hypothetical protein